ncbi:MAG TPA: HAD-IIIA family hydrolase [Flavitalea sp.]|nr:HAD-IIIA family hydrolase [Flavitalea sp.]
MFNLSKINSDWTLFLDRDGVINVELHLDYVKQYSEFQFMPGVLESLSTLAGIFPRIVIVTNQRGIGRGLMTDNDLSDIHALMIEEIVAAGGRVDHIYYCSAMDNADPNRKPNPGMALLAKSEIPGLELNKSLIVGNNLSDMEFGRNAGMHTVHVRTTHPDVITPHPMIDLSCADLPEFTQMLVNALTQ